MFIIIIHKLFMKDTFYLYRVKYETNDILRTYHV